MKKPFYYLFAFLIAGMLFFSCDVEDPGPLQEVTREYPFIDFDQLEMGSGFKIQVEESTTFAIIARGDRRNINDLDVYTMGGTLVIKYDENGNRRHDTRITIRMPRLKAVHFSGGSISTISGFESDEIFNCFLSGGSTAQVDGGYRVTNVVLTGGSRLRMYGLGDELSADLSGASQLSAFDYPVRSAKLNLSGASQAKVTASDELKVTASGASDLTYRGNPTLDKTVSGASSVRKD